MISRLFSFFFAVLFYACLLHLTYGQQNKYFSISGYISDKSTGEHLPYANIIIAGTDFGAASNRSGYYVLTRIPTGNYEMVVSYVGYRSFNQQVVISDKSIILNIALSQSVVEGEEVIVEAERKPVNADVSVISLQSLDIKRAPIPGEPDLLRMLQTLPGVTFLNELSSKIYIRGSDNDQTLILIDGVPIYYPAHLFGIYSTFNTDAIKNVQLIKGGFPAEYGGRSGAVIDITNNDGNREQFKAKGSVGLISSKLNLEGPIGNGSYYVGGRRTYFDLGTKLIGLFGLDTRTIPDYYFYDVNVKLKQQLSRNDYLTISSFYSRDFLNYYNLEGIPEMPPEVANERIKSSWGNNLINLKWIHLFKPELFLSTQVYFTEYAGDLTISQAMLLETTPGLSGSTFTNRIFDIGINSNLEFKLGMGSELKVGLWAEQSHLDFKVDVSYFDEPNLISGVYYHTGGYIQHNWMATSRLKLQTGIRGNYYLVGKLLEFEPRFSLRYRISNKIEVKSAWGIYRQYKHMASPPTYLSITSIDFWFPIDKTLASGSSMQAVAGIEVRPARGYLIDIEVYNTTLRNVVEMKTQNRQYSNLQEIFRVGSGNAYGIEILAEKKVGRLTGWIGYTFSWSERQFPDVNEEQPYPARHHRLHDLTVVTNGRINRHWSYNLNWHYATGQPYTAVFGYYRLDHVIPRNLSTAGSRYGYNQFSDINAFRLPPYHRLDVGLIRSIQFKNWRMFVAINIFNLYSHRNVVGMEEDIWNFMKGEERKYLKLLPIIPSISADFEF